MWALLAILVQVDTPKNLSAHSAGKLGDTVIVAGALNEPSAWLYSISRRSWRQAPPMPERRVFAGAAGIDGKLILVGGLKGDGSHSADVNAYNIATGKWSTLPPLPAPVSRVAACISGDNLYVSGGYNGDSDSDAHNSSQLLCLNLKRRQWTRLPSMPTPRHAHCLVAFQGRLWAIGGHGNSGDAKGAVESYDPAMKSWRKEHSLGQSRGFFGSEVIAGKLIVFGTVEGAPHPLEWSPSGWKPRPGPDLPIRRFAYVKHGSGFLVFGGEPEGPIVREYRP